MNVINIDKAIEQIRNDEACGNPPWDMDNTTDINCYEPEPEDDLSDGSYDHSYKEEIVMERKVIMVTGHRPNKLPGGYNLNSPHNVALKNLFINILEKAQPTSCITGMALGVDQIFALAVIAHKEKHPECKLIAAIPCPEQASKWPLDSQKLYLEILNHCDYRKYVSEKYDNACMKVRNNWMVKHCTSAIAVYDGTPGGTQHAINSLMTAKKPVLVIHPSTGEKSVLNKR